MKPEKKQKEFLKALKAKYSHDDNEVIPLRKVNIDHPTILVGGY